MAISALQAQRAAKLAAAKELMDGPAYTPEAFDAIMAEVTAIEGRISREEELRSRLQAEDDAGRVSEAKAKAERDGVSPRDLFAKWMKFGLVGMSNDESQDFRAKFRNTMSTGTGAEGGFTVQSDIAATIVDKMKDFSSVRGVATVITTESGNPLSYPTSDGTAEEGIEAAENEAAPDLDPTFGNVALNVIKYTSRVVTVPIELIMDSAIDVEAFVSRRLGERLGRITNKRYTLGTGSGQPRGVVTGASQGIIPANGTSQVTAVTIDSLISLVHSVDPAYRTSGRVRFMLNDDTFGKIRGLKDGNNRPIWNMNGYEGSLAETILGYPVSVNNHMANMAANAKSILFGDFTYYYVRDALGLLLQRYDDSAYAKRGQVGFNAWMRTGGNVIEPAAIKFLQNAAS